MTTATLKKPAVKKQKQKPDEKLVEELINLMESGKNPWIKEWDCRNGGKHQNLHTGHIYSGQNPALLSFYQVARSYPLPLWVPPGQAKTRGWIPRKGSKACYIVKPNMFTVEVENSFGEKVKEMRLSNFSFMALFNVKDLVGVDLLETINRHLGETTQPKPEPERMEKCEKLFAAYHAREALETQWLGSKACYSPSLDIVTMPERNSFHSGHALYSTWAHELAHSTGHKKRLKRPMLGAFGADSYAKEELVAELAAYLISHELNINSDVQNHANYLKSWITCLRKDRNFLFTSLKQAQAAKEYVLHPKKEKTNDN